MSDNVWHYTKSSNDFPFHSEKQPKSSEWPARWFQFQLSPYLSGFNFFNSLPYSVYTGHDGIPAFPYIASNALVLHLHICHSFQWELFTPKYQHGSLPFFLSELCSCIRISVSRSWSPKLVIFSPQQCCSLSLLFFSITFITTWQIMYLVHECIYCRPSPTKIWTPIRQIISCLLYVQLHS